MPPGVLVLVTEVGLGGLDEGGEGLVVLGSDVLEGNNGSGLLVNDRSETGLVLDDDVRDTHLTLLQERISKCNAKRQNLLTDSPSCRERARRRRAR